MNTPLLIVWPHFEIDEHGRAVVGDMIHGPSPQGETDFTMHAHAPVAHYRGLDSAGRLEIGSDDRQVV